MICLLEKYDTTMHDEHLANQKSSSHFFKNGGCVPEDPHLDFRRVKSFSLSVGIYACLGASTGRRPPSSVIFWFYPKCHMIYSNYLYNKILPQSSD